GRIEQLGRPEELYEHPTTEFVAGFLGVSNLLDGEISGRAGDLVQIRLTDGTVLHAPEEAMNGATQVRVGIRPEKLRVLPAGAEAAGAEVADAAELNALEGTVLDASYIGVSTQYIVRTADGHKVTVYAQNLETSGASEVLSDGQRVTLTWRPQHTFVIDHPSATQPGTSEEATE
ncbi:MAG: TOBE domain-containing protein, partial [Chloroflexi bacterium]|nr:TOBE domain-containing protein [Chloroflexota bacterium]